MYLYIPALGAGDKDPESMFSADQSIRCWNFISGMEGVRDDESFLPQGNLSVATSSSPGAYLIKPFDHSIHRIFLVLTGGS